MSNGNAEASRSDGMLWMAQEFVAVSLIASPGVIANWQHQRCRRDRFRNAQGREESSKAKAHGAPYMRIGPVPWSAARFAIPVTTVAAIIPLPPRGRQGARPRCLRDAVRRAR
jgi:hypothetical protein